ncbi:adenylate/guanylate cyclase domain-containing protein [Polyangium aurulentum]|uniref:adenylate/guanylate cyclase domain-containing protein n=1 Tax=Polyangium aurulentum TaxID=2567896 RepID=UPI0010AE2142|nr:adenylate/guanylate cyclase domain-containing protein [Polyangium aurulentum]UQA58634.1 adenylate/guanylate cyclase domain-containing protein [Polyangium aurulentum]
MKLGSLGARALMLFAAVGLVPVGVVVVLLIDANEDAVYASEQHLQASVVAEVAGMTRQGVDAVRSDARAVAVSLHQAASLPPGAQTGDGLDGVRAMLGTRRSLAAVRFEVPERNVSTVIRSGEGKPDAAVDAPASTPALRRAADEHGFGFAVTGEGKGVLVVPIPSLDRPGSVPGYVSAAVELAPLQRALEDVAARRFGGGSVGLAVVDAERKSVAASGLLATASGADTSAHPIWQRASKDSSRAVHVGWVAPYRAADGTAMMSVVEWVPELGWSVALVRPEEEAYRVLGAMRRQGALVAGFAVVLALLAALASARWVARPILELVRQTRLIGERRWRDVSLATTRTDEIGQLTTSLGRMAGDLEQGEAEIGRQARQRADLGRFLSKELVEAIVSGRHALALGGERAGVSVLFADVVAFTPLAETRSAEEVVALLNELFSVLTEVVFRHGGTVDKFIGDCIMAVWGAPVAHEDHAARALAAAEDMMRFLETANEGFRDKYGTTIELGIGINSGEAIVGNIGSDKRMEYTVIGDVVNVAARLEAVARPNQVLVAEATRALAGDAFELRLLGERALTGRQATTKVFELVTA